MKHYMFVAKMLLLIAISFSCEDKQQIEQRYTYYEPVYTPIADIRASVKILEPQKIIEAGKIYVKDHWLFINELGKGIHVIDNSNTQAPQFKAFINIPGNYDLVVKGDVLYADSYIDLLAFDISDKANIKVTKRLEGIFSVYNRMGMVLDAQRGIATSWKQKENVTITDGTSIPCCSPWGGVLLGSDKVAFVSTASVSTAISPGNPSTSGVGGSTARFTIANDFLYLMDASAVHAVNIDTPTDPIPKTKTVIAWDIETIFPHEDKIFFGAQSGMYIYSVVDPENPSRIGQYNHVRTCDPVVVEGDLAYVTLRSGTTCQGFSNQLEVIDIRDLKNPQLLKIYPMTNPHGLGIDNKILFVCDGNDGLKIYDAKDHLNISNNQLAHYKNINTFDVIPYQNVAITTSSDGIYQYDYSDPKAIKLLSRITVSKP